MATLTAQAHAETKHSSWGKLPDGSPVDLYTMTNSHKVTVSIATYGGIVTSIKTPDRKGALGDIVLGFDSLQGYLDHGGPFFGALIGRYGNRIGGAKFTLDGKVYNVDKNDG